MYVNPLSYWIFVIFDQYPNAEGESIFQDSPSFFYSEYKFSIHLIASVSLILPKYLWVVERFLWRKINLLTISIGTPERLANVAAWRLKS